MIRLFCVVAVLGITGCAMCDSDYPHGPVGDAACADEDGTTGRAGSVFDPAGVTTTVESPPE